METTVFSDETVQQVLDQGFKTLKVDIDEFDGINLKQHFAIKHLPSFLILNAQGEVQGRYTKALSKAELLKI
ncbi:MAG: hypothetical protein AAGD05_16040, partial [Bacteroidota bacterium]